MLIASRRGCVESEEQGETKRHAHDTRTAATQGKRVT